MRLKIRIVAALSAAAVLVPLAGCHANKSSPPNGHASAGATHWGYVGDSGPAHWGSLALEYSLCDSGRNQSPINITNTVLKDLPNIKFHYRPTSLEIINNGHTIQVNCDTGSFIDVDGVRYELVQFHFHSPGEHEIAGDHAEAELHLVHKAKDGALVVVGVMIESGEHNAAFDPVWKDMPEQAGPAIHTNAIINAIDLLPSDRRTIRYEGSLTTPPGTEGVKWNLMVEPITLSKTQLSQFRRIFNGNNRPGARTQRPHHCQRHDSLT